MQEEYTFNERTKDRMNIIYFVLLMLLLTSPGFSFLGSFIGSFFPNQRLALGLAVLLLLNEQFPINKNYVHFLCASIVMFFVIVLRIIIYPGDRIAETSDMGLIIFIATIPAYIELFNRKKKYLFKSLLIVIYLQIGIAIFQNVMMSVGLPEMANMFNNYHRLNGMFYTYPQIIGFFYRTSGLFIESSQYSIFLCFCYICIDKIAASSQEKYIASYTKYIVFIAIFINYSITGYLTILLILAIKPGQSLKMLALLISTAVFILYLSSSDVSELSTANEYLFQKINSNINKGTLEPEAARSNAFYDHIETVLANRPIFGYGDLKEEMTRWDFVSTYLYGYGLAGFITMSITVALVLNTAPIEYYILLLLAFTTNGNLQIPMYLVILPIVFICKERRFNKI